MLYKTYRLVNLLSLDVAAGAMITSLFFATQLMAPVRIQGIVALGLTVWVIYTADRLIDIRQLKQPAASERHRFHQQYRKLLWVLVSMVSLAVCLLIMFIRPSVIIGGLALTPIIALYLLLQKKLPIKELAVAVLYTLGVLLPAWPGSWEVVQDNAILIGELFSIALANLLLFAWFETEQDTLMGQSSLVTRVGEKAVTTMLYLLIGSGIVVTGTNAVLINPVHWIFFCMWLVLAFLYYFKTYFKENERYRIFGDAIFYLPILSLL